MYQFLRDGSFPTDARGIARHIFDYALRDSSIGEAFQRNVSCERGVLGICEDLYDLNSFT